MLARCFVGDELPTEADALTSQNLGPELMLYDAKKDHVHILNQTAKVVWEGVVAGRSEEEIAAVLRERFAVEPGGDPLADVRKLIEELRQKALLKAP